MDNLYVVQNCLVFSVFRKALHIKTDHAFLLNVDIHLFKKTLSSHSSSRGDMFKQFYI